MPEALRWQKMSPLSQRVIKAMQSSELSLRERLAIVKAIELARDILQDFPHNTRTATTQIGAMFAEIIKGE